MNLPKIYTDASVTDTKTILGIFSDDLSISHSVELNFPTKPHLAEELAHVLAKCLVQTPSNYHTDNLALAQKLNLTWIPRHQNRNADVLTRAEQPIIPVSRAAFIRDNYPLPKKLKLIATILNIPSTDFYVIMKHSNMAKLLLFTLTVKSEWPSYARKNVFSTQHTPTLKDRDLVQLLLKIKRT